MQPILQPLVRGISKLGGRLRTIFESIVTFLSGPRATKEALGVKGAVLGQLENDEAALLSLPPTNLDRSLEIWDVVLETESEDRLASPVHDRVSNRRTVHGTAEEAFFLFAIMTIVKGDVRVPRRFPARIALGQGKALG
jgi:hypothetical protein